MGLIMGTPMRAIRGGKTREIMARDWRTMMM
jgi:hypothetical protein